MQMISDLHNLDTRATKRKRNRYKYHGKTLLEIANSNKSYQEGGTRVFVKSLKDDTKLMFSPYYLYGKEYLAVKMVKGCRKLSAEENAKYPGRTYGKRRNRSLC